MTRRQTAITALLAAAILGSPARGHAMDPPVPPPLAGSTVAMGLAAAATITASFGFFAFLFQDVRSNPRTAMIVYFTAAAVGVGLGSAGLGIQAAHTGRCDSTCVGARALGGVGVGVGGIDGLIGILFGTSKGNGRGAYGFVPVPLLLATDRGPAIGVGLTGVAF